MSYTIKFVEDLTEELHGAVGPVDYDTAGSLIMLIGAFLSSQGANVTIENCGYMEGGLTRQVLDSKLKDMRERFNQLQKEN